MLFAAAVVAIAGCLGIVQAQGTSPYNFDVPASDEVFNVTFNSMAPLFTYGDSLSNLTTNTVWNRAYVNSDTWEAYTPGVDAWTGPINNLTNRPDLSNFDTTVTWTKSSTAIVVFGFVGTGFTIHGYAPAETKVMLQVYSGVSPQGLNMPMTQTETGVWEVGMQDLPFANQTVGLSILNGTFYLTGLTFTTALGGKGATATVQNTSVTDVAAKNVNPAIQYDGAWWISNYTADARNGPMASTSYAYVVNATTTPVPSLEFDVPVNTSIACLWGVPSPSFAPYQVSVSPRPYDDVDIHSYVPSSSMLSNNFLLHMASLDPLRKYTIKVEVGHTPGASDNFAISHATWIVANGGNVTTPPPSDGGTGTDTATVPTGPTAGSSAGGSSGSSAAAIGGGIGGAIAASLIIGLLAFFLRRALKRNKIAAVKMRQAGGPGTFTIDDEDPEPIYENRSGYTEEEMGGNTTVTPFPATASTPSNPSLGNRLSLHESHRPEAGPLPAKSRVFSSMRTRRPRAASTDKSEATRRPSVTRTHTTDPHSVGESTTDQSMRTSTTYGATTLVSGRDTVPEALEVDPDEDVRQHQDGGRVAEEEELRPIREVPPVYDVSWAPKPTQRNDNDNA